MSHRHNRRVSPTSGDESPVAGSSGVPGGIMAGPASRQQKVPATAGRDTAAALLIGLLAGILGLAPWLITGARLPLQNLWGSQLLPGQMPLALLPLSQYEATTLVSLMTTGAAAAGLAVRRWSPARRRLVTWCAAGGVLLVQATAAIQAFNVVGEGLAPGALSRLYLAGLLAGVLAAIAAGLVLLLLLAARSPALVALGVGLAAVPFVSWVASAAAEVAGVGNAPVWLTLLWRWFPAVLVGVALAWCGLRPAVRAVVWAVDLGLLWVVPAGFTAVSSVLGTRVLGGDLQEMSAMGKQVFAAALGPAGGAGPKVLLALAIALLGAFGRFPAKKGLNAIYRTRAHGFPQPPG
ncbi:hypothetical protein [Arthrobacter sp. H16F315]|uniref:hypothetical protein n=1 Tax=Arthrobacter sp. H16F315 TaxID=2955314 RepID=UPI002096F733|nr:hypothetical protein [Arthrobacter sp. H16F315]